MTNEDGGLAQTLFFRVGVFPKDLCELTAQLSQFLNSTLQETLAATMRRQRRLPSGERKGVWERKGGNERVSDTLSGSI
jgi:hypothetical protein